MIIRFIYNDIASVNKIYSTFDKQDRYYVNAGSFKSNSNDYLYNPEGDFATRFIHDDFGIIVTMLIDNTPVAYACVMRAYDTDTKKYTSECELDFGVHPEYRHRGIAKKILSHILAIVKRDKKYQTIYWNVVDTNKSSIALAIKFGFSLRKEFTSRDGHTKIKQYIYTK